MINGIVQIKNGFAVKDFDTDTIIQDIGKLSFPSYEKAVDACSEKFYPAAYHSYLTKIGELQATGELKKNPDADVWENLIYADDYRGIYDGEKKEWRNVTALDKGASTEEEIDYVDALAFTYASLMAMAGNK